MSWNQDADWDYIADGLDRMAERLVGQWAQGGDVGPSLKPGDVNKRQHCVATMANAVFGIVPVIDDVMEIVAEQIGVVDNGKHTHIKRVIYWNDYICKTEQEAINACRGSAIRARDRAKGIADDRMIQRMTTL